MLLAYLRTMGNDIDRDLRSTVGASDMIPKLYTMASTKWNPQKASMVSLFLFDNETVSIMILQRNMLKIFIWAYKI